MIASLWAALASLSVWYYVVAAVIVVVITVVVEKWTR